ncbi:unnamed protein product [Pieris brassicae]|uniref:PiggyBac transposable element-derived protein domain-containing protein n=1 Tax=Pieris brassicae TaxID=7116 RepID=A0A9P0X359_PIEBR|nr:unnamed protein product [Pieris brassicae]
MPILTDGQSTSINDEARESDIPVTEESWSTTVTDIPDFNFDNSATGITVNIDDMEHVIDFFHLMFPQNYVQYLVDCTNAYGHNLCNSNRPHTRHSRKTVYRETTYEEMIKFMGLSLLKGHVKCPQQRSLFSLSNALYYHPVFN